MHVLISWWDQGTMHFHVLYLSFCGYAQREELRGNWIETSHPGPSNCYAELIPILKNKNKSLLVHIQYILQIAPQDSIAARRNWNCVSPSSLSQSQTFHYLHTNKILTTALSCMTRWLSLYEETDNRWIQRDFSLCDSRRYIVNNLSLHKTELQTGDYKRNLMNSLSTGVMQL